MPSYKYSYWDGSEDLLQLQNEDLMEELSEYLLSQGDLQSAMRMMMQRGMKNRPLQGLQDLMQQLRSKRQETLDKYQLDSVVNDLQQELQKVVETERESIQRRMDDARQRLDEIKQRSEAQQQAEASQEQADAPETPQEPQEPDLDLEAAKRLSDFLDSMVTEKLQFLDQLPKEFGGALTALTKYEFMDPEAQRMFDELMEKLRQQVAESMMQQMSSGMDNMGDNQTDRLKDMLKDLNEMLQDMLQGEDISDKWEKFKENWQEQLDSQPPESLQDLLQKMQGNSQQMQNFMESLHEPQRSQMQDMMNSMMADMQLQQEMSELMQALSQLMPNDRSQRYPFRGEESLDLQGALELMEELERLEDLEKALRKAQYGDGLEEVDLEQLKEMLGEEAAQSLETLKNLAKQLEEAGYIRQQGDHMELTPRGIRKIGQKALSDVFDKLKEGRFGKHETEKRGIGIERLEDAKAYEFGDPFYLDLHRTLLNAVVRKGAGVPINLDAKDFEVYKTEHQTESSTVLMLDLSWSMARRGSFYAAKKVILALHNLIRTQFPRDAIYIVGFSTYARELKPNQLPYITWDQAEPYTNMQQGFMISQKLLSKHKTGTKQILMISDGEPTAHIERGQIFLGYPPSPRTISETLREVKRCTRDGIIINVFMLDRSYYLREFVDQMTKINRGRAFYTSPDTLGEYVMVDYLRGKRRHIA